MPAFGVPFAMKARHCLPLLAIVVLAVIGCGGDLVNAKGRLTYKGKGVPSTLVTFWPQEEGKRASTGVTDDDGNFTLSYSRTEPGVLRGQHTVFLKYHLSMEEELGQVPPKASKELKEVIARYGNLNTSTLRYEIKSNGQFIEIDLQ
jgi:hypothetical protein